MAKLRALVLEGPYAGTYLESDSPKLCYMDTRKVPVSPYLSVWPGTVRWASHVGLDYFELAAEGVRFPLWVPAEWPPEDRVLRSLRRLVWMAQYAAKT